MKRLKEKWGIESNFQFWVIMVVFSLAGMSVVRVKFWIYHAIGLHPTAPMIVKILAWPVIVIPAYYMLLMFWGTVLGQYRFVWWFTQKTMRRMKLLPPEKAPDQAMPEGTAAEETTPPAEDEPEEPRTSDPD